MQGSVPRSRVQDHFENACLHPVGVIFQELGDSVAPLVIGDTVNDAEQHGAMLHWRWKDAYGCPSTKALAKQSAWKQNAFRSVVLPTGSWQGISLSICFS